MMPRPETIARHELTGLWASVETAPDPSLVGLAGRVIRETRHTLVLRGGGDAESLLGDPDARARRIPKRDTTFAFELPDGATVSVDGERLIARPARRTETGGVSPWV